MVGVIYIDWLREFFDFAVVDSLGWAIVISGTVGAIAGQYFTDSGERRSSNELDARSVGPDLAWCTVAVERPPNLAGVSTDTAAEEVVAA